MTDRCVWGASRTLLWALMAGSIFGQTSIDLKTQSKAVDFTGSAYTRPVKTGVTPPATCSTGELFFDTDAVPGSNLQGCVAASTWVQMAGSLGLSGELTEFRPGLDAGELVISCLTCRYGVGNKVFVLTGDMRVSSVTGSGGSGMVFVYLEPSGVAKFGYDGSVVTGASLTNLTGESGVTQIPSDAIAVASCAVSGNAFTSCTDLRAVYSRSVFVAGAGMALVDNPTTGATAVVANPAVLGFLGGSNVWTGANDYSAAAHTLPAKTGLTSARPLTCTVGELYFAVDGTAGKNLHFCTATNTWTVTP